MTQEAIDKVLDGLNLDEDSKNEINEEEILEDPLDEDNEENIDDEEKPSGFITYEDWVAAGKDPKKYRGEEAFDAHGKTLKELKDQKEMLNAVLESMNEWKANQKKQEDQRVADARREAENVLKQAMEDEDMEAALNAKDRIHELNSKSDDEEIESNKPNPVIVEFSESHPIIDKSSAQFDQDFYDDMAMIQGSILDKLTGRDPQRMATLTARQIKRSMETAYSQAKELHPEKFKSKRNARQSQPSTVQKRNQPTMSSVDKLKGYGRNSRNPRDTNPAMDIYEMLKEKNPEVAESFLNRITQE